VLPIAMALGIVFGGMYLLGQPLTLLTAVLVSITIGLGIDYNIHISDRFAQELDRGRDVPSALREALTGTGGALLGSAVTSGGAFSLLIVVPHPQFNSFGIIVALALGVSFLLSVFVLPSVLWLWARVSGLPADDASTPGVAAADDD
jgi:predicted RND superfamily exporter protein